MIKDIISKFHETIKELVSQMDHDTAENFLKAFNVKMKEPNEQTHLQKNSRSS
jgi:hypothetical protein